MKKTLIASLLVLFSFQLTADEIKLSAMGFDVQTENGLSKLEDVARNPEDILKRYVPVNVTLKSKTVNHAQLDMVASKSVMFLSKTMHVRGVLDINPSSNKSKANCYDASLDFAGSDQLVTDNIDSLQMELCATQMSGSQIHVTINSKIIKGKDYNSATGSITTGVISDQISGIAKAIQASIKAQK
jgi:hypothetical protein